MERKPRIEIHRAKNKEFFLTLKSPNNRKVLTSGETYKSRGGVENALKAVKKIMKDAAVLDKAGKKRK